MKQTVKKDEYDLETLKIYMRLPAVEKLKHLEELNKFLILATPPKSKKIWQKLKKMGW